MLSCVGLKELLVERQICRKLQNSISPHGRRTSNLTRHTSPVSPRIQGASKCASCFSLVTCHSSLANALFNRNRGGLTGSQGLFAQTLQRKSCASHRKQKTGIAIDRNKLSMCSAREIRRGRSSTPLECLFRASGANREIYPPSPTAHKLPVTSHVFRITNAAQSGGDKCHAPSTRSRANTHSHSNRHKRGLEIPVTPFPSTQVPSLIATDLGVPLFNRVPVFSSSVGKLPRKT